MTEIPAEASKDQTGIRDVLFERNPSYDYDLLTIGANDFSGTTGLTGMLVIPQTVSSIGANAFAVETTVNISEVDMGSNATFPADGLTFGTDVFKGRTITNLHIMGNLVLRLQLLLKSSAVTM